MILLHVFYQFGIDLFCPAQHTLIMFERIYEKMPVSAVKFWGKGGGGEVELAGVSSFQLHMHMHYTVSRLIRGREELT